MPPHTSMLRFALLALCGLAGWAASAQPSPPPAPAKDVTFGTREAG